MTLEEKLIRIANEHGSGDSLITKIMPIIHSYGDTREIDGRIKEAEFLSYRLAVKHTDMSIVGKAFTSIMAFLKDRIAELRKKISDYTGIEETDNGK